jgi:hypothetical protein
MSLGRRLERLETEYALDGGGLPGKTRSLKGLPWPEVCEAVLAAIDPADEDLFEAIHTHVETAAHTLREAPSRKSDAWYEGCEQEFEVHFFVYWLWGLPVGSWALPEPVPRAVLEGFNARYGCVLARCEDCLTGLGNGNRYSTCPVCGSEYLSCKKLSGPPWDPHWVYTPLPHPLRKNRS